jgi:hypothetical protein
LERYLFSSFIKNRPEILSFFSFIITDLLDVGGGLGAQGQGIAEPIQPVIRPTRRGLGYEM